MSHVTEERATRPASGVLVGGVWRVVAVVAGCALAGALAGVVWEWLWTAPQGVAIQHEWAPLDLDTYRNDFSGTGWYVVVASVAGLLASVALALALDRWELLTLAAVLAGSALAAWVMLRVGEALGPPDPQVVAATADDGTRIPAELAVTGGSPYLSFAGGALLGLIVVFFGVARLHRKGA